VSRLLLDTHAAVWLVEGGSFSIEAEQAFASATANGQDALVSPMTAWEIAMLAARGRLQMPLAPLAWFERLVASPGIAVAELTPRVLVASCFLPGIPPRDPVDRILAATARECGYRLMTRDSALLEYAEEGHLDALAC
jgi:PIN domain nuclease of toxin-antitoxin system